MEIFVKPSDLKYKYPRDTASRDLPKFRGKPDPAPFNRDDLYEIIPMFSAVMTALGTNDGQVLHLMEDILIQDLPRFIDTREQVFDCLFHTVREHMERM
jgi:hypothetical protein